jgi:hypothetical protein
VLHFDFGNAAGFMKIQSLPSFRFVLAQSVHDVVSPWRHTIVSGGPFRHS